MQIAADAVIAAHYGQANVSRGVSASCAGNANANARSPADKTNARPASASAPAPAHVPATHPFPHDVHFTRPFNAVFTLPIAMRVPLEVAAATSSNLSWGAGPGLGRDMAKASRRHISHFNGLSMRCAWEGEGSHGVVEGEEYYTQHYANALMAF